MYKLTNDNSVIRLADNATIPFDTKNQDYQFYLEWLNGGHVASPADALPNKQRVTMAQARLALHQQGLLSFVDAAIAQAGQAAQIEWEFRSSIERDHPLVNAIKQQLSWTDQQIDDLFELAASL